MSLKPPIIHVPTVAAKEAAMRALYSAGGTWCWENELERGLEVCVSFPTLPYLGFG